MKTNASTLSASKAGSTVSSTGSSFVPASVSSSVAQGEQALRKRLLSGHRNTLARAITLIENEAPGALEVMRAIFGHPGRAMVVGVTGAPGVGKSTLVSAYIGELRRRGHRVAVIAVDPSSPVSGGAILGDRVRMGAHAGDEGVFVRSLSSRGHSGGLTRMTARVVDVMDAAGMDVIVLETVGIGQLEIEVADIAHTKVVVMAPGMGDEIQAIKAGILEIADVLVVNKGDNPLAMQTAQQLRDALALTPQSGWRPPVLVTTAPEGLGVPEMADAVEAHARETSPREGSRTPRERMRKLLGAAVARQARERVAALKGADFDALCDALLRGDVDFSTAAGEVLAGLGGAETEE
ncbi:MAG: methylmalonyl Co-A mutase-associated GTPase MeaB [SAR324 cluster bacterium]|nr:methylmalonyl Co-A mutase-associated GTPase MeaB [SAR324 cluster bacterium]